MTIRSTSELPIQRPTVGEASRSLWDNLPLVSKVSLLALLALVAVLLPANLWINSRLLAITRANLSAAHQTVLMRASSSMEALLHDAKGYLQQMAVSDAVLTCARRQCTAEADREVFASALQQLINNADLYYTELGWLALNGKQILRARRDIGNEVNTDRADLIQTPYRADGGALATVKDDQPYIFAITRDARIATTETYQQPVLRLALPVVVDGQRQGYLTSVINLDDFFAEQFVYSDTYTLYLLDSGMCMVATSDDTRRTELYRTWNSATDRICYNNLPSQEWDVTISEYGTWLYSSHVIHGDLTPSGQVWTLLLQQPLAEAYAQYEQLRTLLTSAHILAGIVVAGLLLSFGHAITNLSYTNQARLASHARDARFNPFPTNAMTLSADQFIGRTPMLIQGIGVVTLGGNNVLITGEGGSGKTALLSQLVRRLSNQTASDPIYQYFPVWLDVWGIPVEQFYRALMDAIMQTLALTTPSTNLHYYQSVDTPYTGRLFAEDVNEVFTLPTKTRKEPRLVVCLDNLDFWFQPHAKNASDNGFTSEFQQEFADISEALGPRFTIVGAGRVLPSGALGNASYGITLAPLNQDSIQRIIQSTLQSYYDIEPDALAILVQAGQGLPARVQQIAHEAVRLMLEQDSGAINIEHVKRAVQIVNG